MTDLLPLNQQTYVRLTLKQLWENSPMVLLTGLLFSLFCIPTFILLALNLPIPAIMVGVITIAPAWSGLLAQEAKILEDFSSNPGSMLNVLLNCYGRSVKLGLLGAFPLLAALITIPALAQAETPLVIWLGLAADVLGLLLVLVLYLYAFPLLVLYNMDFITLLRNSFILSSRYLINTFGLLSLGALGMIGVLYLSSGLIFFFPALWGIFIVNNCRLVMALVHENSNY